jgi:hypothetical protein
MSNTIERDVLSQAKKSCATSRKLARSYADALHMEDGQRPFSSQVRRAMAMIAQPCAEKSACTEKSAWPVSSRSTVKALERGPKQT